MKKDYLYPLRKLHGELHECKIGIQGKKPLIKYLRTPFGKKVYVFGSPDYDNLGDSAILIAEMKFLEKVGFRSEHIKEITVSEYLRDRETIRRWGSKRRLICGLGGGNMGNQWPREERFRSILFEDFRKNPAVIFPQTIHFIDNGHKNEDEQNTVKCYDGRKKLTIVARERHSEEIMRSMYPHSNMILAPDIVLSGQMEDFGASEQERDGVLFCCRSDSEKSVDNSVWERLQEVANEAGKKSCITDMNAGYQVTKDNRRECVRKKMQEFCSAELVITDRLHGMIFAALTGTPCIVFSNYNHKVKGTYDWISYLPYIRYVETEEEAVKLIPELLKMKNCKFDNTPLIPYFDKLAEVVKEKCRR